MSNWLVVQLKVQDGKQAEFEGFVKELVAQVRAKEPDVLTYTLTKNKADPTEYVFVEHYKTKEARDAHGKTDYFRAAGPKFAGVLAGAPKMLDLDVIV